MKNENGASIIVLLIITVLIMIGVAVIVNYSKTMLEETKLQDLKTNMLLIQAEAKKGVEEVCFQTVNLDETKAEDLTKINEMKKEHLEGIILTEAPEEVKNVVAQLPVEATTEQEYYYLDEETLSNMGIKDYNKEQSGYFLVKYDFSNTGVEVINTNGYNGVHTLTELNELEEGIQEEGIS